MRVFGNLTNRIMEASRQPTPKVGMGATVASFSDRYACTVVNIGSGKLPLLEAQEDKAIRTDKNGMSESQDYDYQPDRAGRIWVFRKDQKGRWREVRATGKAGRWRFVSGGGSGLVIGTRDKYHDFSF